MKLTKLDMALVPETNPEAIRRAQKGTVASLAKQHALALAAIASARPYEPTQADIDAYIARLAAQDLAEGIE